MTFEPKPTPWEATLNTGEGKIAIISYAIILLFCCIFVLWAALAPLQGAVLANGAVAASGRNIQIQHLEGGIISKLFVSEGDRVTKDQALFSVDSTSAEADVNKRQKQQAILDLKSQRLVAERDNARTFVSRVDSRHNKVGTELETIRIEEQQQFKISLDRHNAELEVRREQIASIKEVIDRLKQQGDALNNQLAIIADDLQRRNALVTKGLMPKLDLSDTMRIQASIVGQIAGIEASIVDQSNAIVSLTQEISDIQARRSEKAASELNDVRRQIAEGEDALISAESILARTTAISPVNGIILRSDLNTAGNVINPGEKVIEILPTADEPRIEAQLRTSDIDSVTIGQAARVKMIASNSRLSSEIYATVEMVSPDRIIDKVTNAPYYKVIVKIDMSRTPFDNRRDIIPGMPAEVFFETNKRTFFAYLFKPILDATSRAFIEN